MAIVKNFRDGSVVLKDGTGTPKTATLPFEQGNFAVSGFNVGQTEVQEYFARGTLIGLRKGQQNFQDWSCTLTMSEFTLAATGNFIDLIEGTGTDYSARIGTRADLGDIVTFDLVFTIEGTDLGDSADHTLTMLDNRITYEFAEGDPNTITLNGRCYGGITRA